MIDVSDSIGLPMRALEAMNVRARVALHNIANQNTPGFKRYVVQFEDRLRAAIDEGRDPGTVTPLVTRDQSGDPGVNNVATDEEFGTLTKVQLMHEIFSYRMSSSFQRIQKAISGRP
jgi:flagellar basal-body rod protein FlgB